MRFTKMAVLMSAALALPAATALAQGQQGSQPADQQQQPSQQQPGQQPSQQQPGQQPSQQQPGQQPGQKPTESKKLSQQDLQIMGNIHHTNQLEIQEAKLAEKRSQNSQVKSFARTMVTDHEMLDHKLSQLAKQHKAKMPKHGKGESEAQKQEMKNEKTTLANLKKLKGAEFDRAFLTAMVAQHQQAINYIQGAENQAENPDLKSAMSDALPVLMKHRAMAQKLQQPTPSS